MTPELQQWRDAIAAVVYGEGAADAPAYLDFDDDAWAAVLAHVGLTCDGEEGWRRLGALVRQSLDLASRSRALSTWTSAIDRWLGDDPTQPPPHLPLLAICSRAAEVMGDADDVDPKNYYQPLCDLLDIDRDSTPARRLINAYRDWCEHLWTTLNQWLRANDGRRGLPTAESVGPFKYVGFPIGQALIRGADRSSLARFFEDFDLAPGGTAASGQLAPLLDEWMATEHGPTANLRRLWSLGGVVAEQVAETAAIELASWTGRVDTIDGVRTAGRVKLTATLSTFPTTRLQWNLLVRRFPGDVGQVEISGSEHPAVPAPAGGIQLGSPHTIDWSGVLGGVIRMADPSGDQAQRMPQQVVVLAEDPLTNAYVEADRATIGTDSLVLATVGRAPAVSDALRQIARPGWRRLEDVDGLPGEFVAFAKVQVVGFLPASAALDLHRLIPLSRAQLSVEGGLRFPGHEPRWSSLEPPEIRAIDEDAREVALRLLDGAGHPVLATRADGRIVIIDLNEVCPDDGRYRVEMFVDGQEKPLLSRSFEIRSAAGQPDVRDGSHGYLGEQASSAVTGCAAGGRVRGLEVAGPLDGWRGGAVPSVVARDRKPLTAVPARVRIDVEDRAQCFTRGDHLLVLPDAGPRANRRRGVTGTCARCGLEKRIPPPRRKSRQGGGPRPRPPQVPTISQRSGPSWDAALDAISAMGTGSAGQMSRVISQLDASAMTVDQLWRNLEVLGHIDVCRSLQDMAPTSFQVNPATLAVAPAGGVTALTGFRSQQVLAALMRAAHDVDVEVNHISQQSAPDAVLLRSGDVELMARAAAMMSTRLGWQVLVAPDPSAAIARALPPFSRLVEGLARTSMPPHRTAEVWDIPSASWVITSDVARTGGYRLQGHGTSYVIRFLDDVEHGTARIADARLVKHLTANAAGRSMLAHTAGDLTVPLGADLPGIYGRAAVLASGVLPTAERQGRLLRYHSVPRQLAEHLNALAKG